MSGDASSQTVEDILAVVNPALLDDENVRLGLLQGEVDNLLSDAETGKMR